MPANSGIATVRSRALQGVNAPEVLVEAHLSPGLPRFTIVGLPETAVRESRDRVRAAIENCRFEFPLKRVVVSLAPADLPKSGGRFDLPIAIGILIASGQLTGIDPDVFEIIGELSLDGRVRGVSGVLSTAMHSAGAQRCLVLPACCLTEAALAPQAELMPVTNLLQLVEQMATHPVSVTRTGTPTLSTRVDRNLDMAQVRGQPRARRALEIAAAGRFNLLLIGPPGTGKTMLARRLPGLIPPMTRAEALETAVVQSISNEGITPATFGQRPFRAPHHGCSGAALVGGGRIPRPGEVSLAHNGVLFLDEMAEFARRALDMLREPLETGHVHIARAAQHQQFPARFQLIGALNPCPCGYFGDPRHQCRCSPEAILRYQQRLSGPLLDRIDLHVEVPSVSARTLYAREAESSHVVAERVLRAWQRSIERSGRVAANLSGDELQTACALTRCVKEYYFRALDDLGLSLRVHDRVLRVARVIADLDAAESVTRHHLAEALSLRLLGRQIENY